MQETIVSLLSKTGQVYEERESFRSWIYRVLRNNWLNHVAKVSASRETPFSDLSDSTSPECWPFDPFLEQSSSNDPFLRDQILAAFSELPAEQQEVCYCVDVEGLSYEETARRLGIPVGTVMSRLHRGRGALKERLYPAAIELRIVPFPKEVYRERNKTV